MLTRGVAQADWTAECSREDRKSTRLNSSHSQISYAVFCLKKKKPPQLGPRRRRSALLRGRQGQLRVARDAVKAADAERLRLVVPLRATVAECLDRPLVSVS